MNLTILFMSFYSFLLHFLFLVFDLKRGFDQGDLKVENEGSGAGFCFCGFCGGCTEGEWGVGGVKLLILDTVALL